VADESSFKEEHLKAAIDAVKLAFADPEFQDLFKRPDLHLVIAKPWIAPTEHWESMIYFKQYVMWRQRSWRSYSAWKYPYDKIAMSKAYVSWRHGLSMRQIIQEHSEYLVPRDTVWPGSVVVNGIICAVSGQDPASDEFLAEVAGNKINHMANGISLPNLTERYNYYLALRQADKENPVNAEHLLLNPDDCFIPTLGETHIASIGR
jgi:hypothetical protein